MLLSYKENSTAGLQTLVRSNKDDAPLSSAGALVKQGENITIETSPKSGERFRVMDVQLNVSKKSGAIAVTVTVTFILANGSTVISNNLVSLIFFVV